MSDLESGDTELDASGTEPERENPPRAAQGPAPTPCPVCCAPLSFGAHLCLKCRSLVRLPRAIVYLAALAGSLPVSIALLAFVVDCRAGAHSAKEQQLTRAAAAAKDGVSALQDLIGLATSIYSARYHLSNSCDPGFRDPGFFKPEPGEGCLPQMLHAIHEFDRQVITLSYKLEVLPVRPSTRARFDDFNKNYWAQKAWHPATGYRQRILNAMHASEDSTGLTPLASCWKGDASISAACKESLARLKQQTIVHIQTQVDATLCSVVSDINDLRKAAHESGFDSKPGENEKGPHATMYRILVSESEIGAVCRKKLADVPVEYKFWQDASRGQ